MLQVFMEAPCLGCLGLWPRFELKFTFDTVGDRPHPSWVLDALEDGPVFIEYTQNDKNCPPCARMRPKIKELINDYDETTAFFIININEHKVAIYYQDQKFTKSSYTEEEAYGVYDVENIAGGRIATPTYVILTIDQDDNGKIRPKFATGYGEFKDDDAEKTKDELAKILDFAVTRYDLYDELYV